MEENIETTTEAEQTQTNEISNDFYVVSKVKFYVMFLFTLGLYSVYWFYKNWQLQKTTHSESSWPVMRGIFSIFFTHDLFRRVNKKLVAAQKEFRWDFETLATSVVILTLTSNILNRLSTKNIGSPFTDIATIVLLPIIGVLLFNAQHAINVSCNDPAGESNDKFTSLNYVWIALGTVLIGFSTIGLLLPEDGVVY